jgi:hypothetical protein
MAATYAGLFRGAVASLRAAKMAAQIATTAVFLDSSTERR